MYVIPLPVRKPPDSGGTSGQGGNHSNNRVFEEGSHPADETVIFSDNEADNEPINRTVNAMRVTTDYKTEIDICPYYSDVEEDVATPSKAKRFTKSSIPKKQVKDEVVSLVTEFCGEMVVKEDSPYHVMVVNPERPGPDNRNHQHRTVLCDTGATSSIIGQKLADEIGIKYQPDTSVTVRGADGNVIDMAGVGGAFLRDPVSKSFRKLRVIVTKKGESFLVRL